MFRRAFVTAILLGCTLFARDAFSEGAGVGSSTVIEAGPRGLGVDRHGAIDNAIAGALVNAMSEQLGGRAIDMKLDAVDVQAVSIRDRTVSGTGSLRLQGDEDWMGFRFEARYDTQLNSTGDLQLSIGGVSAGERDIPNDVLLVQELDDQVVGALRKGHRQDSVRLQLDRISTVEAGSRYLHINADGVADFGRAGSSRAQIEAFYDRFRGRWLHVRYELGDGALAASRNVALGRR